MKLRILGKSGSQARGQTKHLSSRVKHNSRNVASTYLSDAFVASRSTMTSPHSWCFPWHKEKCHHRKCGVSSMHCSWHRRVCSFDGDESERVAGDKPLLGIETGCGGRQAYDVAQPTSTPTRHGYSTRALLAKRKLEADRSWRLRQRLSCDGRSTLYSSVVLRRESV